ncbi:hypothetical protein ABZP36_007741 [Zizania latifolia]
MTTLVITVDLECCRCSTKIQKILCCMQERGEFAIEKVTYEKDKVVVSGPFDAEKLYCKLLCKAGRIIKEIKIVKPEPKKPEAKKPDEKPKPEYKIIPYPYPYPYYPQQQYCPPLPCGCATPHCECHSKPQPPAPAPTPKPTPPPAPAKPATCGCSAWSSCHSCSSYPPYLPPMMPYPPMLFCDESPAYGACAVM